MENAKLKGKIKEKFGTQARFAEALGKDQSTISQKLAGKTDWTASEIKESCTECPLSFNDGGPIRRCGISDRFFSPAEWDISPTQRWQAFADETRRADP